MGILQKVFGGSGRRPDQVQALYPDQQPARRRDETEVLLCEGRIDLDVVGESHYQDSLWRLVGGRRRPEERVHVDVYAVLTAETDNPYDANAVSVWVQGLKIGHLSRGDAKRYRPGLQALEHRHGKPIALRGVIVGGGMREDGPGMLGVFLRHDPTDFGLHAVPSSAPQNSRMRTGRSDAIVTDDADDSYDLSWMNGLPEDDIRAITMLRQLLTRYEDPLDRHFMYAYLEALLYRSRDAFASALEDYDQACHHHDEEMDGIRQAFVTKWGRVPVLDTYRQMAIRQQKAKNFEQALWWADRGLALYGENAARPEAVEDLRQRSATYRARLVPTTRTSRSGTLAPVRVEMETLNCVTCGCDFERTRVRGRKPMHCPQCDKE
jgi:predicted Zn-ribbon and HTH transcriptional regulator